MDSSTTSMTPQVDWPTQNAHFLAMLSKAVEQIPRPALSAKKRAIEILNAEMETCNRNSGIPYDICIWDQYPSEESPRIGKVLTALYYRGRIQYDIMNVFLVLVQCGLVSIDTLRKPVTLGVASDNCNKVHRILCAFEAIVKEDDFDLNSDEEPFDLWSLKPAYEALDWLAAMIVRGSTANFDQILEAIRKSGHLGDIDKVAFERYKAEVLGNTVVFNADERVPVGNAATFMRDLRRNNDFGFWLPHGLGDIYEAGIYTEIHSGIKYFHQIQWAFKDFFDLWDDWLVQPPRPTRKQLDSLSYVLRRRGSE